MGMFDAVGSSRTLNLKSMLATLGLVAYFLCESLLLRVSFTLVLITTEKNAGQRENFLAS